MRFSGISWSGNGFEVTVLDAGTERVSAPVPFGIREADAMIAYVRRLAPETVAVIDSTNGMLDGRMMATGVTVYRADPQSLPPRPAFGSVTSGELARAARRDLAALTRLVRNRGTQTGREDELEAWNASSVDAVAALAAAGHCLSRGQPEQRQVALTFDDGPHPPYTGQVLDILERYGVPATFFCIGLNAGARVEEIERMGALGHEFGNHTWSHPFLPELSHAELAEQIARTAEVIAQANGGATPSLFRPPYGSRTPRVLGWLGELEPRVVLWDVEAADWAMPGADVIARRVLDQARSGSIILLHDGGGDRSQTVAALPMIIEGLLERGYQFVRVADLAARAGHDVRGPAGHAPARAG